MFGILKVRLIETIRSLQSTIAAIGVDDGDDSDIATPKTCIDDDME